MLNALADGQNPDGPQNQAQDHKPISKCLRIGCTSRKFWYDYL